MKIIPLFRVLALVLASVLVWGPRAARAAEQASQNYAVLSLIGDELSIVTYGPAVGSNLDSNRKQSLQMRDDSFDRAAVFAADTAIRRAVPGAATILLSMSDRTLYALEEELFASPERSKAFLDAVVAHLKNTSARYLILITKYRSDARLKFDRDTHGSGKLSGLRFYLDYRQRTTRTDTGESGAGFIAPFAYLAVSLIDMETGSVIRTRSALESTSLSTARSVNSTDPWEVLTPEQKVRAIQNLIRSAVESAVPQALAPA